MRRLILIVTIMLLIIVVLAPGRLSASGQNQAANPEDVAQQDAATKVYWTETRNDEIRSGNADGSGSATICKSSEGNPSGLVVSTALNKMYWIERDTNRMPRADLNCANVQSFGPTLNSGDRLAIDENSGKIYWTENQGVNKIRRANLDGSSVQTILGGLNTPVGIAIDPVNQFVYWTELGTDSIWQATLEGDNRRKILQMGSTADPLDIVLDVANSMMYWTEADAIYEANMFTGDGVGLWGGQGTFPHSLAIDTDGGKLYWADWNTPAIRRANLNGGNSELLFGASDGVDRSLGVALLAAGSAPTCYSLTLTHSGSGNNPVASPSSSSGCANGKYVSGELITLSAMPAAGWRVAGWNSTNNDGSTSTTNTVTMPAANRTVSVIYEVIPVTCYTLTRNFTGNGSHPVPNPAFSSGCGTGQYTAGQSITLTASPATGWSVAGWSGTNNDSSTSTTNTVIMPAANHAISVTYEIKCYSLSRTHSGQGNDPVATPAFSAGCGTGYYIAGESITLTASPAANWSVAGWSGTNNNTSNSTTNSLTMPAANHAVSVIYANNPPPCFSLTRLHTGQGNPPVANPALSSGCGTGQYTAGQSITLTASPAAGWRVANWSGTNNDSSSSTTNSIIMPAGAHTVSVTYRLNDGPSGGTSFIPLAVLIPYSPLCFSGPTEQEPNNTAATANGPLCRRGIINGLPNDQFDLFTFQTTAPGNITIEVKNLISDDAQLVLHYQRLGGTPVDSDTDLSDGLKVSTANAPPGKYIVFLYDDKPNPAETRMYAMDLSFP